jgi:Tol biopolymer transport system component
MTMSNDPRIFEFLDREAGPVSADYLDELLARTARTRQRPAWASIERWLPMDITANRSAFGRLIPLRAIAVLTVLALLIAALLTLYIGSRHPLPPPFGLAANGELLISADGDIYRLDPKTGVRTALLTDPAFDFGALFSRDGTKFMALREGDHTVSTAGLVLVVANADGSDAREIARSKDGLDWVDWSPDGNRIAFLTRTTGRGEINHVNVDGSGLVKLNIDRPAEEFAWLSPAGSEIVFRSGHQIDSDPPPGIWSIHPDGTGLRQLSIRPAEDENDFQDVAVSLDGTLVAYRDAGLTNGFHVHLLDVRTGADRLLPTLAGLAQAGPVFSPDGLRLVVRRWVREDEIQLAVVPIDGSTAGIVIGPPEALEGEAINNYAFSPDGTYVIANYDVEHVTRLLPLDGSPGKVLAEGEMTFAGWQRVAP